MTIIKQPHLQCNDCPIRDHAVCSLCNDDELAALERIKFYREFAAGEQILWRGDALVYVASVVKGVALLSKSLEDGRTQTLGLLLPSDFIGRPDRTQIAFDVTAVTNVTLCCFDRKTFEKCMETMPHLTQKLLKIAFDELDATRDWMLLLGRKTARERVATFILMFATRTKSDSRERPKHLLALPLTREEIANYLGLTLETVSRQFSSLKKEGMIHLSDPQHFEICNMPALIKAAGDDDLDSQTQRLDPPQDQKIALGH